MPINAHPDYIAAEREYNESKNLEDKIEKLKKMISLAPGHKGAEKLRAQLRSRLKRLQEQLTTFKKTRKGSKVGIKKADLQVILVGKTNSGKSYLLKTLTNANPKISETKFTTNEPVIGILEYEGIQIQLIENPAIEGENFDKGLVHTTDTILILITSLDELKEVENLLDKITQKSKNIKKGFVVEEGGERFRGREKIENKIDSCEVARRGLVGGIEKKKIIIVLTKSDELTEEQKRKISATLQSKKYNFILISSIMQEGIEELKEKIFKSFNMLRVFTKEPGKEKSKKPIILKPGSTVRDVAEKILKGFSKKIKETRIWGPSSKFGGQVIGLAHELKDLDVVEFKTK